MGRKSDQAPVDPGIAALAQRQYGVATLNQLLALGLGEHGLYERVRTKRLIRLHRGVYAVGHRQLRREGYWLAAVLACGPGAVLSYVGAAELWSIRGSSAGVIDVTVPSRAGRVRRKGIRMHRSSRLDLADVLQPQALKRAIDESEYQRLFDLTSLIAVVNRNPGRRGATLLRAAADPPHLTRSELENRFLASCTRHNLPEPRTNQMLLGYEVDAHWPQAKVVVELDGYAAHGTRRAFPGRP